jgi:hypothetical protein
MLLMLLSEEKKQEFFNRPTHAPPPLNFSKNKKSGTFFSLQDPH